VDYLKTLSETILWLLSAPVFCLLFLLFFNFILAPIQMLAIRRHWPLQHVYPNVFQPDLTPQFLGIKVFVHGKKSGAEAQFIVSNHPVSWTDTLCLSSVYPVVFLAKSEECARWPSLGLFAKIQKTIFIPRHLKQNVSLIDQQIIDVLHSGKSVRPFPRRNVGGWDAVFCPFTPLAF
jgi:1-acyl-sn-glycerol-3-phosphate acyltransferase